MYPVRIKSPIYSQRCSDSSSINSLSKRWDYAIYMNYKRRLSSVYAALQRVSHNHDGIYKRFFLPRYLYFAFKTKPPENVERSSRSQPRLLSSRILIMDAHTHIYKDPLVSAPYKQYIIYHPSYNVTAHYAQYRLFLTSQIGNSVNRRQSNKS